MKKGLICIFMLSLLTWKNYSQNNEVEKKSHVSLTKRDVILDSISSLVKYYGELIEISKINDVSRDSVMPFLWELCPNFWELKRNLTIIEKPFFDSIKKSLSINNTKFSENQLLVNSLLENEFSLITIEKPIFPIFQSLEDSIGIYSSAEELYYGDDSSQGDSELLRRTNYFESIGQYHPDRYNKLFLYEDVIDSLYTIEKKVFTFSTKGKYSATVRNFGIKNNECTGYFFYGLQQDDVSSNSEYFLFGSNFDLELEFVEDKRVDAVIKSHFDEVICADCPGSWEHQKVFAKLLGFENLYFTYAKEPNKEIDGGYTAIRSLIYVNKDVVFDLWTSSLDLFGCSCL